MPKIKKPVPVCVLMSDEEFQEFHKRKEKEKLLDQLIAATTAGSFSVKKIGNHKERNTTKNQTRFPKENNLTFSPSDAGLEEKPMLTMDDDDFEAIRNLASEFNPPSPIDEVTHITLGEFRLSDAGIKETGEHQYYKNLFKNEQAMLSEILQDVTTQAKWANSKLNDMTKKSAGYGGVAKTYPDLISAANSLNTTRLHIIDKMASLKKTVVDLEMKRAKEMGTDEGENKDALANQFFAQIVGNRKQFVESAMANVGYGTPSQQASAPELPIHDGYDDSSNIDFEGGYSDDGLRNGPRMRSITSPIYQPEEEEKELYQGEDNSNFDPYGYIHNENRSISICIQRFPDGRLEFVAIDENGDGVDDYELPDDDLLLSLEIRPLSNFATDEFGRRYRIIDIDSEGIDISDV